MKEPSPARLAEDAWERTRGNMLSQQIEIVSALIDVSRHLDDKDVTYLRKAIKKARMCDVFASQLAIKEAEARAYFINEAMREALLCVACPPALSRDAIVGNYCDEHADCPNCGAADRDHCECWGDNADYVSFEDMQADALAADLAADRNEQNTYAQARR